MRIRNVIGGTVLGIATLFMTAPGAFATESASIGFDSQVVKPGDSVQIFGKCTAPGFTTAKLHSAVLVTENDLYAKDATGTGKAVDISGFATVRKDAKNGKHEVWYMCGKIKVTSHITVTGGVTPKPKPKPAGQVAATPKGSADTGGGATVATPEVQNVAAPVQPEGVNYAVLGLGGVGVLATAGVGVLAYRRLRRES